MSETRSIQAQREDLIMATQEYNDYARQFLNKNGTPKRGVTPDRIAELQQWAAALQAKAAKLGTI